MGLPACGTSGLLNSANGGRVGAPASGLEDSTGAGGPEGAAGSGEVTSGLGTGFAAGLSEVVPSSPARGAATASS